MHKYELFQGDPVDLSLLTRRKRLVKGMVVTVETLQHQENPIQRILYLKVYELMETSKKLTDEGPAEAVDKVVEDGVLRFAMIKSQVV